MVPETGNAAEYSRFLWLALGKGAIGFSPFGFDDTGYVNYPLGAKELDDATIDAFAAKYRLLAPAARSWARIAFEHPVWGAAKMDDAADQTMTFGRWKITVQYDQWQFAERDATWIKIDPRPTKGKPVGGALVAQLGPDQFLLTGSDVRLRVDDASGGNGMMLRVEEGHFDAQGNWVFERVWNGDQTDYGLNFTATPVWLKVTMGTWK
jgi:beta-galactosidase GanA